MTSWDFKLKLSISKDNFQIISIDQQCIDYNVIAVGLI